MDQSRSGGGPRVYPAVRGEAEAEAKRHILGVLSIWE
jgi:hypothetical protein